MKMTLNQAAQEQNQQGPEITSQDLWWHLWWALGHRHDTPTAFKHVKAYPTSASTRRKYRRAEKRWNSMRGPGIAHA